MPDNGTMHGNGRAHGHRKAHGHDDRHAADACAAPVDAETVAEHLAAVLAVATALAPELASLDAARGLVLAEDIRSATATPPFDNSAMDKKLKELKREFSSTTFPSNLREALASQVQGSRLYLAAALDVAADASLGEAPDFVPVQAARNAAKPAIAEPWMNSRRETRRGEKGFCSFMCLLRWSPVLVTSSG